MEQFEQPKQRPTLLTVFGILTFIGSGFAILGVLINVFTRNMVSEMSPFVEQPPIIYGIIGALLAGAKIFGVIQMFKLQRQGFFMYAGAEVLTFILAMVQIPYSTAAFDVMPGMENFGNLVMIFAILFNLIFTGLFIGIYASQLKHME